MEGELPTSMSGSCGACINGKLYVFGGYDDKGYSNRVIFFFFNSGVQKNVMFNVSLHLTSLQVFCKEDVEKLELTDKILKDRVKMQHTCSSLVPDPSASELTAYLVDIHRARTRRVKIHFSVLHRPFLLLKHSPIFMNSTIKIFTFKK